MQVHQQCNLWKKPLENWLTCNVDMAFFSHTLQTVFRRCIRYHHDQFVAAFTFWILSDSDFLFKKVKVRVSMKLCSGLTKEVGKMLFLKEIPKSVDAIHCSARLASEFGSTITNIKTNCLLIQSLW
jgi:hypothetical protein